MEETIKKLEKELQKIEDENVSIREPHPVFGHQESLAIQLKNSDDKELITRLLNILKR